MWVEGDTVLETAGDFFLPHGETLTWSCARELVDGEACKESTLVGLFIGWLDAWTFIYLFIYFGHGTGVH